MIRRFLFLIAFLFSIFPAACRPGVIFECIVSEDVEVYVDLNRNGRRDADEPPLEGIEVRFFEIDSGRQVGETFKTDASGRAAVGFISGGDCNPDDYEVNLRVFLNDYDADSIMTATLRKLQETEGAYPLGLIPRPTPTPYAP